MIKVACEKNLLSTKAQNKPVYQVYISPVLLFENQGDGVKGNRVSLTGITYILPCNNANKIEGGKKNKKKIYKKMHKPQTIKKSDLIRAPSRANLPLFFFKYISFIF